MLRGILVCCGGSVFFFFFLRACSSVKTNNRILEFLEKEASIGVMWCFSFCVHLSNNQCLRKTAGGC